MRTSPLVPTPAQLVAGVILLAPLLWAATPEPSPRLEDAVPGRAIALFDSYHCSRYNLNTGRLTPAMFETVMAAICGYIQEDR